MDGQNFSLLRKLITLVMVVCAFGISTTLLMSKNADAAAGINQQINFQGRLLNAQGAVVPDGYYNIQFKIYQDGDGQTVGNTTGSPSGSLKWTESHLNQAGKGVQVKNGFVSVQLGSVTAFGTSVDWNQDTLWISMNVGNTNVSCTPFTSCGGDGEMIPMKRLSSTPYALNSGQLGGKTSAQFLQLAQGVQTDASINTTSVFINKTSTGNFLQLQASSADVFTVTNSGDITLGSNANHSISIATSTASTVGRDFTFTAGSGGSGTGSAGGALVLQGGAAGGTNANGGDVTINAGAKTGTGTAGVIALGTTNTSVINLNQNTTVAAGKSLALNGGITATRPASPTEGMIYFDTTTKQLITYANGKWQADRSNSTVIVASSASGGTSNAVASKGFDGADYVNASTTSAQTVINSAISSLPANGGSIYLMEGTYIIDGSVILPANVTLAGAGSSTIIKIKNSTNANIDAITNSDTTNGNTNITITSLRIDGNKANNSSGTQNGIILTAASGVGNSNSKISNLIVENMRSAGITVSRSQNGSITSNTVQSNNSQGIDVISTGNYNLVSNNTVQLNAGTGIHSTSANSTISGNISRGNTGTGHGIWLDTSSDGSTVTSNITSGNSSSNIRISSSNNSITGNTSNTSATNGINAAGSNNVISGNKVHDNGGSGTSSSILVGSSSVGNSLIGNDITDTAGTGYAIDIPAGANAIYLSSNRYSGTGASSINNSGTGTIFGGQVDLSGNFLIQPAGTIELMKNTTVQTGTLTIGTSTVAGNLTISDGSSNTATITVGNLAGNYTYSLPVTTANDTICLQTFANCASTGVTTVGTYSTTNTAAGGATITGNTIVFQDASGTAPGMVGTGAQTFAGNKTFTGTINTSSIYQVGGSNILSGSALTFTAASTNSIEATSNQSLNIQGGIALVANTNGGNVSISGGTGNGTGTKGIVTLGPSAFSAGTNATCSANCTISQSLVDNNGTIVVNSTGTNLVMTLPAPTNTSITGRILYVATASGSTDYTLTANSGGNAVSVAMRQNTTASMIWNGTAWTPGGASNATTLQAVYNNGSNPGTTPELKLDTVRGTIDIQDADTTIGTDILNIRGSNASGLGTVLFGVSNTGRVTIQGTTDQSSAFRVLGSNGDYLFNINSANSYVISNATRSPGNEISNPGLETGGEITSGEEGWFGPANVSIQNDAANAKAGNHVLQVSANSTNTEVFAGGYYEVLAGETLYFEGWVKNSAGGNGNAGLQITWYNKDKSPITTTQAFPGIPGTTYVQRTISGLAPANTHYARVSATVRAGATTGTYYFDNFYMKRSIENADMTFRNSVDTSTAFRIQSAGAAQTIFTANTSNNTIKIGDNTGSGANTTLLVLDSATSDPSTLTGLNGGIFYRSDNNSLKAVIGGAVVDICTTAVTCSGYSASAGSAIALQGSTPGTQQVGNFNISGTGILTQLQTQDNGSGSTQSLTIRSGNSIGGNSGNLVLDVGTATGTKGTITIGSANVATTMPGNLAIQGSNSLTLGSSTGVTADGSILFRSSAGSNTITIKAPSSNPTASYTLALPTTLGAAGECLKTDATGNTYFQGCGVGVNFNLQDAYNNSGTPADITLANGKDFQLTAQDAGTDPNIIFKLNCVLTCGNNGRFAVQNGTTDILSVLPNGGGIILNSKTQIGSGTTDATEVLFQLDSYNQSTDDPTKACSTTVNQGAMYYNTSMGSIRSCINGAWSDVSNPDTLGLLTFGIVPSSGGQPYDLPSLITNGSSGPCKVSWASANSVSVQQCTAYSNGRRLSVPARILNTNTASGNDIALTTANRWGHICINPTSGEPAFTSTAGTATPTANMPTFSAAAPILCLADVVGSSTTAGTIDDIYDVRTFTSAMKEAVNLSTATQLGMTVDAGTGGAMTPAVSASAKLYGTVVATDGATSAGAPNAIVTTVGPAWVKATAGTAGQFVKTSTPNGYSDTTVSIPNNSFYYSVGNTRTSFSTTCNASTNCAGSLYVNFIVR